MTLANDYARAYTLLDLIIKKYGEDRIALGIAMITHWLSRANGVNISREAIEELVWQPAQETIAPLRHSIEEPLRQLFGLQTLNQLYNKTS